MEEHCAGLPCRPYGRDGDRISIIGMGGIAIQDLPQAAADRVVAEAVERGVNYFDVSPTYGESELRLGPALASYRKDAFLACKTTQRRADGARAELDRSLERLRTDHFDLYQLHGIASVEKDVDVAFAAGGAMEVLLQAKREGRVRHLGFSAHSEAAAEAAMERYDFDSILFPVNFACWFKGTFGPRIVAMAREKGLTVLALKSMARQRWPADAPERQTYSKIWYQPLTEPEQVDLALQFTLTQPVAALLAPGEVPLFRLALDRAEAWDSIAPPAEETLRAMAADLDPVFS